MLLAGIGLLFAQMQHVVVYKNAGQLMELCRNITLTEPAHTGDVTDYAECVGYVTGVVDGLTVGSIGNKYGNFPVCLSTSNTVEQLVRVVLKYGDNHPERLNQPAVEMVKSALIQAFPCGTS